MEPARVITAAFERAPGDEGEALLRVAAAAAGTHELEEVLEVAAEEARAAVSAASLSVSRWEEERGLLRTIINVGDLGPGEERYPADEVYPLGDDPVTERLLRDGIPYFNAVDDPEINPWSAALLKRLGKESDVAVPILVEDEVWGEVYATTAPGQPRFRGEDVRFLEAVAGQLALAIGRAELFTRVSRLAYEDPLTGLANRRAVEERLERLVMRANERDGELAVLLCDVDDLKAVNDAAGHAAGDGALRRVGEALVAAAATRPGSLVGRLAGDEFCVVLDGGSLVEARAIAAATLRALAAGQGVRILVSCGAAALGPSVATPAVLLRAADAALYRAKRNGGGQIFTAGSRAPDPPVRDERRALRRSLPERVRDAVHDVSSRFEGDLADEGPLERVEAVAMALAEALNAAAWAVSSVPAGGYTIHTVSLADDRDQRLQGLHLEFDNDVYSIDDYPATARLIQAGAGAFVTRVGDGDADRAERALLQHEGREGVLVAAAVDRECTWLLEVYGDEHSSALEEAVVEGGLLIRAAMPPRPAGRGQAALLARRTRQVRVTSALATRLAAATDPLEMTAVVADELYAAMGVSAAGVMRVRHSNGRPGEVLDMATGLGLFAERSFTGFVQPAYRGLVGRCLREGRAVLATDVGTEPDFYSVPATREVRSELDVPVEVDGRPWGAITVQDTNVGAFDEADAELLVSVAVQLAAALSAAE
ncbi:MAG TPA: diguanylate cyclase [Thermoleophilaceae bacterium]|nr:diguanylate cyclase [Thermoleophilaceae bacterium]